MTAFLEFISRHWDLVTILMALGGLYFWVESLRAGATLSSMQATKLINDNSAVIIDLRDKKEFDSGHLVSALHIPYMSLKDKVVELSKHKDKPILLICKMGHQSGSAGKLLRQQGFTNVSRLSGGMMSWTADGLPLVKD